MDAIICDLDGTLAINGHGRDWFDCTDCDVAIATITETHSGTFYAKAYNKETKEEIDSFEKAFSETFVKQARLEKRDNAENPEGYVWGITAVSIGIGGS